MTRPTSPNIPCARCGTPVEYNLAVKATLSTDPDAIWVGYVHPTPCKERIIRKPSRDRR